MMIHSALAYSGLAAALVLLAASQSRALAIVAVLAAALEVLIQLQILRLQVAHLPLDLLLGILLAAPALVAWFRSSGKAAISAGAIATFIGLIQIVVYALPRV
ncbi:MAG TPA: hypothetical protein VFG59_17860 [Anaeromyxobacter sp.]|nr:hypothetical protein [Anaeromyxobacter sp.]